ncbi:hypothetical protein [Roseimicrobium sp. ORNL1]|uniref:hypothetical protein n=1 Tax=Roseimicrobium sp. ORNL1 TaxID=2711231 RepID=UPI0013E15048|nr:hypothetical protein [Roseimicrobium sp. ORNL1]QIF03149.1 hypothetical protein G5S37_17005 [Roseimicrobium sp. ORNL1]
MADKTKLRKVLLESAQAQRKTLSERQLTEATEQLVKKGSVTREDLRQVGRSVAADPEIFAVVDTGKVNDILTGGKN